MAEVEKVSLEASVGSKGGYYTYFTENSYVRQASDTYEKTKKFHPLLDSTLSNVEGRMGSVRDYATEKASYGYENYCVQPKNALHSYYNSGAERTRSALETSKNAVVMGGTLGIGAAVVLTQFSLSLSAGGAALVLGGVGAAQNAGTKTLASIKSAEKAFENRIYTVIENAQRLAMVPVDKMTESSNALLDILDTLVERTLAVEIKSQSEASVRERVAGLAAAIVHALTLKAHTSVIDPVTGQINVLTEKLSKSLVLVDVVRSKQEWVVEKVEELSVSVSDLKAQLEKEALHYRQKPEEVLMNSIRATSSQLQQRLEGLREKGQLVFGDGSRVDGVVEYLKNLDKNLGEAENVYKVRDEVISEARQRIGEITAWTTNMLLSPFVFHKNMKAIFSPYFLIYYLFGESNMISGDVWQFEAEDLQFQRLLFEAEEKENVPWRPTTLF
ncbi:unnamed protein product [Caenorhabditis auriculariae]|uniref:Uncharacterized protein n=1 Tax=Caenorhabditis auriculariae TaxID=2777116 RepID=A0A8S1GLZ5_9PELO|nr:unnamed protein product [Caenorhabditis auriculariae]